MEENEIDDIIDELVNAVADMRMACEKILEQHTERILHNFDLKLKSIQSKSFRNMIIKKLKNKQ